MSGFFFALASRALGEGSSLRKRTRSRYEAEAAREWDVAVPERVGGAAAAFSAAADGEEAFRAGGGSVVARGAAREAADRDAPEGGGLRGVGGLEVRGGAVEPPSTGAAPESKVTRVENAAVLVAVDAGVSVPGARRTEGASLEPVARRAASMARGLATHRALPERVSDGSAIDEPVAVDEPAVPTADAPVVHERAPVRKSAGTESAALRAHREVIQDEEERAAIHDRGPAAMHEGAHAALQERENTALQERENATLRERENATLHEREHTGVHPREHTAVRERERAAIHERGPAAEHERERTAVYERARAAASMVAHPPRPRDGTFDLTGTRARADLSPPRIAIQIGRIEVRAVTAETRPEPAVRTATSYPLDTYLQRLEEKAR
ncbi:hypothetical protein [Pendulispora albinea]|uniref:Uncharacterized protein n=1 Tax=Pendulispora albinea TaxID=2741071 RepID=A0ABZ2MAS2_9BACT